MASRPLPLVAVVSEKTQPDFVTRMKSGPDDDTLGIAAVISGICKMHQAFREAPRVGNPGWRRPAAKSWNREMPETCCSFPWLA
jgi:hypothetical protein